MECSRSVASAIQPYAYYFSSIHILLSLTAFLGNSLILVALHKESSLHPPSKVLYSCLATTDLLVGLVVHPLAVIHFMSYIHEDWGRCRWTYHAALICVMFSIFVDDDGHKRGQTSRSVVGVEIQTNCNCKAHPCHFNYLLDCNRCRCFMPKLKLPHDIFVRLFSDVLLDDLIRILHKDF